MEDPDLSTSHASAVRAGLSTRTALRATHVNSLRNTNMHGIQSPGRAPTGQTGQRVRAAARLEAPLKHEFEPIPLAPKTINFQLLLSSAGQHRARLPLRIRVGCHDGPDKIVETVKSFYGLYEGEGVSFQDHNDVAVTAHYDSVPNNATIFVRIIPEPLELHENGPRMIAAGSPRKPRLEEPFQMLPPLPYTRPSSRTAHKCTTSPPSGRNRRDGPARVQPQLKTKTSSMGELDHDIGNGHSDSDAGSVSVSSSRRAKSDHLASADISVDNIVEGGRRKRAKFESSVSFDLPSSRRIYPFSEKVMLIIGLYCRSFRFSFLRKYPCPHLSPQFLRSERLSNQHLLHLCPANTMSTIPTYPHLKAMGTAMAALSMEEAIHTSISRVRSMVPG